MRTHIVAIGIAFASVAAAQRLPEPTPVMIQKAGLHIEQATVTRDYQLAWALFGSITTVGLASKEGRQDDAGVWILASATLVGTVTFHIVAQTHDRKAARPLQGINEY